MPLFRLPSLEIQVTEINIWFLMGCFATLLGEWKNIAKGTTGQNWVFVSKRWNRNNDKTALNIQANFMVWPNHSILCHITDNQMSSCSWAIRNAFLNTNINISNKIWAGVFNSQSQINQSQQHQRVSQFLSGHMMGLGSDKKNWKRISTSNDLLIIVIVWRIYWLKIRLDDTRVILCHLT